jgi:hypothetical protein
MLKIGSRADSITIYRLSAPVPSCGYSTDKYGKNHMEVFEPCIVLGSKGKVVREISGGPKDQLQIQPHKDNVAHVKSHDEIFVAKH